MKRRESLEGFLQHHHNKIKQMAVLFAAAELTLSVCLAGRVHRSPFPRDEGETSREVQQPVSLSLFALCGYTAPMH